MIKTLKRSNGMQVAPKQIVWQGPETAQNGCRFRRTDPRRMEKNQRASKSMQIYRFSIQRRMSIRQRMENGKDIKEPPRKGWLPYLLSVCAIFTPSILSNDCLHLVLLLFHFCYQLKLSMGPIQILLGIGSLEIDIAV